MAFDPISAILNIGATIIDRVVPDKNEAQRAKDELNKAVIQQGFQIDLAQIGVNLAEAQSDNIFKSGWRPMVGWVCALAFALQFLIFPILNWTLMLFHQSAIDIPFNVDMLMYALGGLLGLGGMRTFEKMKGVA
jgi:hypothetical protein